MQQKQLLYLWKVLNRNNNHWTKVTLLEIGENNIGWGKMINTVLHKHKLPTDYQTIRMHSKNEWTRKVKMAIKTSNKERLLQDCHKKDGSEIKRKTKTAHIVDKIEKPDYQRSAAPELLKVSKQETKTILIARFGMLECGTNFKGTLRVKCSICDVTDDEDHRLNHCTKYASLNSCNRDTKINFQKVFTSDTDELKEIVRDISQVWNVQNSNGSMNEH